MLGDCNKAVTKARALVLGCCKDALVVLCNNRVPKIIRGSRDAVVDEDISRSYFANCNVPLMIQGRSIRSIP